MIRNTLRRLRKEDRSARWAIVPHGEALEDRKLLNATSFASELAFLEHFAGTSSGHHKPKPPVIGTIQGQVTDQATSAGVKHVKVELINAEGKVEAKTTTNSLGQYSLGVTQNGPVIVREVTPKHDVQVSPTFSNVAPTGSYAPGFGSSSWNYTSTNTNPALGPVGPAGWPAIAPAGADPFGSPVNLTGKTVDLSKYLTINYNTPTVPSGLVNNSHQIQVQFPSVSSATVTPTTPSISVGGQTFYLSQFHYHDPAENLVDGQANTMEEHFVNVSPSGAETVVAVFLTVGAHNNALDPILQAAQASLTTPNSTTQTSSPINFAGLLPTSTQGWFYEGSLTTPPLSQPVTWFVYKTPITLDSTQLAEYQQVASGSGFLPNARPVQATDGRRFNEIDNNVNFQGQSLSNVNFVVAPAPKA